MLLREGDVVKWVGVLLVLYTVTFACCAVALLEWLG